MRRSIVAQSGINTNAARTFRSLCAVLLAASLWVFPAAVFAQEGEPRAPVTPPPPETAPQEPAGRVEVQPAARDHEIRERLLAILGATGWFTDPEVSVNEGVVFLKGQTDSEQHKKWAGDLARKTQDVVAVVNQIELTTPNIWDFSPAWSELTDLARGFVQSIPLLVWGLIVLVLAWGAARLTAQGCRILFRRQMRSQLLREAAARACGILVFLLGLYLVLRVAGLTRLALTVLGGTGLLGLTVGIAFREITENFLASIFLSLQHPFREGDLVEVAGILGYVQGLTSRTTILMTLKGNQVQIPNATVFKSTIRNYTSNANRREDFTVGIGYDAPVPHAQEVALAVLAEHPAVLKDPEPWVLVDNLGPATVNLRVYFWLDGRQHSWLKVRSSVIRLVKRALQDAGINLPDEAREIVFPRGVPIRMLGEKGPEENGRRSTRPVPEAPKGAEDVTTAAEAGLRSEAGDIEEQARHAWSPGQGENLLAPAKAQPSKATTDKPHPD